MNAMVTNILMYEKELENQRQARGASDINLADEPWVRAESRWSFMAELFRFRSRRRRGQGC